MADPTDDTEGVDPSESGVIKDLRAKAKRAEEAEQALVDASQELAFYKAGLGDLTDEQRDDVLTLAKARGQTTADDLKAIADRLSYASKPAAPTPTETATAQAE